MQAANGVNFAIVCIGREGSEYLASLLDSHQSVTCKGEAYRGYSDARSLCQAMTDWPGSARGMKLPLDAFETRPGLFDAMREFDIRVIRLSRKNLFDQFLSMRLSQEGGDWSSTGSGYTNRIEVDPVAAQNSMRYFRTNTMLLREATRGFPSVDITYEEIPTGIDRIFRLLDLPPMPLETRLRKQRAGKQSDNVTNYPAVERAFAGTEWAEYLTG
jgi:hypothetical protein